MADETLSQEEQRVLLALQAAEPGATEALNQLSATSRSRVIAALTSPTASSEIAEEPAQPAEQDAPPPPEPAPPAEQDAPEPAAAAEDELAEPVADAGADAGINRDELIASLRAGEPEAAALLARLDEADQREIVSQLLDAPPAASPDAPAEPAAAVRERRSGRVLIPIVLTIAFLAVAGAAAWFFLQQSDLLGGSDEASESVETDDRSADRSGSDREEPLQRDDRDDRDELADPPTTTKADAPSVTGAPVDTSTDPATIPRRPSIEVDSGPAWLEVSWLNSETVNEWQIEGPLGTETHQSDESTSSYSVRWSGLPPGTHIVRVRAGNAGVWSDWSSATAQVGKAVPDQPTVRVTGGDEWLEATWAGSGEIDTWQVDGPDGIIELAASQNSFSWGRVSAGSHTVRVRAGNSSGWSDWGSGTARVDELPTATTEAARDRLEGSYVSVLVSATSESGAERARERLERQHNQTFGILLSDDYESLRPGYWVVFAGPFDTARESQRACWNDLNRRSGAECYGRRLSQDRSDRDLLWGPSPD